MRPKQVHLEQLECGTGGECSEEHVHSRVREAVEGEVERLEPESPLQQ